MRSHLTRRVFRCLIANEPLFPHQHLHTSGLLRPRIAARNGVHRHNAVPQRTFFNLFDNKQKDLREPNLDPGMDKMLELDKRIHLIARLPPAEDLIQAFNAFVASRDQRKRPIEDFHAVRLLQTLQTLESPPDGRQRGTEGPSLAVQDVRKALHVMTKNLRTFSKTHSTLARLLFKAIEGRPESKTMSSSPTDPRSDYIAALNYLIIVLCQTGESQDALDLWLAKSNSSDRKASRPWARLLSGFVLEDNEAMLLHVVGLVKKEDDIRSLAPIHKVMALYYAQKDNVEGTKEWTRSDVFDLNIHRKAFGGVGDPYRIILEFCLRNNEMEWGQSILETGAQFTTEQKTWDAIIQAAAATGKSVDDIDRMVSVMAREASGKGYPSHLAVETFNGLLEFALSRKDAYTAERYFSMAETWNVKPNARSYVLQVEYRLAAGDINGAMRAYSKLKDESITEDDHWLAMNKLLLAVLAQPNYSNETVISLVEDISDRRRVFPADTVIALCEYHLKRDEYLELVDLLQTYAYQYSIAERMRMRDHLVAYTLDPSTDTGRAWDTYMIFHQIFDIETARDIRNDVITSLFNRARPDLATHVFTRMSRHVRADTRPNEETYVRMFEGVAKTADEEALEVVHNLLKLDTETDPTTRIRNGLMLAYSACDAPRRALEFWDQVSTSDEGPTYNSLHIAFRACEKAPWGYKTAGTIWEKLCQSDIVIEKELFASYVGSLAGQSLFDEVVAAVEGMEEVVGEGVDAFTYVVVLLGGRPFANDIQTWLHIQCCRGIPVARESGGVGEGEVSVTLGRVERQRLCRGGDWREAV
jgi:hypothetical protein